MLRTAPRQLLRQSTLPLAVGRRIGGIRHQSSGVPRRSFKNGVARWAIAIGGTYWYMTSPIFNDEPAYVIQDSKDGSEPQIQTIASVKASSKFKPPHPEDAPIVASTPTSSSPPSINPKSPDPIDPNQPDADADGATVDAEHARALEQEATQQGAFNEETGEINWDCPCLGGMAHGPCGESFRDAFSCFVFSKEEPKGMDCIDKFERMQTCFREHPEIYAEEIADDERVAEFAAEEEGVARLPGPDGDKGEVKGQAAAPAKAAQAGSPDVDQPSVWTPLPDASEGAASKGQKKADVAAASAKSS